MSWWQLKEIMEEAREDASREADRPPDACPNDGYPLVTHSSGARYCPLGDYSWEAIGVPR